MNLSIRKLSLRLGRVPPSICLPAVAGSESSQASFGRLWCLPFRILLLSLSGIMVTGEQSTGWASHWSNQSLAGASEEKCWANPPSSFLKFKSPSHQLKFHPHPWLLFIQKILYESSTWLCCCSLNPFFYFIFERFYLYACFYWFWHGLMEVRLASSLLCSKDKLQFLILLPLPSKWQNYRYRPL